MTSLPGARPLAVLVTALVAIAGCSRAESRGHRGDPGGAAPRAIQPFDFTHPLEALTMSGDTIAARAGSFSWEGDVTWTVAKPGVAPVKAIERHRVRQLATGEFDVAADIDPGAGPGSETGKQVVFTNGVTYGRGRWAPFRERPADRGNDARRFRDQSLLMAADLVALYGPALAAEPAGEITYAGRRARRFRLVLTGSAPVASAVPSAVPGGAYDPDTKRHVAFLQGRVPTSASGELVLDENTGVPLSIVLQGSFSEKDDAQLRAEVDLTARVKAFGPAVAAVRPPRGALASDGRPRGVARALEAAGLRQRSGSTPGEEEEHPEE